MDEVDYELGLRQAKEQFLYSANWAVEHLDLDVKTEYELWSWLQMKVAAWAREQYKIKSHNARVDAAS